MKKLIAFWVIASGALAFGAPVLAQPSQPLSPVLSDAAAKRFEFAPIPELVFVRGIAETMQLGAFQLDHNNRWPPGDLTRSSGWASNRPTRLLDSAGQPVTMFGYNAANGELTYNGTWSGEILAKVQTLDGLVQSNEFRIRVLTPTVVYGNNAGLVNTERGWGAKTCEGITFALCRQTKFGSSGGSSYSAPLVVFITSGRYQQDWFLGSKRFVYVLGNHASRPVLVGDRLTVQAMELFQARNLNFETSRLGNTAPRTDVASHMIVSNVRQCCENGANDGIVNPHGRTLQPWKITLWSYESVGMGDRGNTKHAVYLEGRPLSTLEIINTRWMGSQGSSSVKTTMQNVSIRHSLFSVSEIPGDLATGYLTHTPIDIPAFSNLIVYGNEFQIWRGPTVNTPVGRTGVLAGTVFLRLRKASLGSDIPAYPNVSWTPPVSSQTTASSPGGGWSAGPETYVNPAFWADVKAKPITDPANIFSFKQFIGFNKVIQLPTSLPVTFLRNDGTHAVRALDQFGPGQPLRVPLEWVERSNSFLYGNTFVNHTGAVTKLNDSELMKNPAPGSQWPRDEDHEFPHAVTITDEVLPPWFKL